MMGGDSFCKLLGAGVSGGERSSAECAVLTKGIAYRPLRVKAIACVRRACTPWVVVNLLEYCWRSARDISLARSLR